MESLRVEFTQSSRSWGDLFFRVYCRFTAGDFVYYNLQSAGLGSVFIKPFIICFFIWVWNCSHTKQKCLLPTSRAFWSQTNSRLGFPHNMLAKSEAHQQCSHLRKSFHVSQILFLLYSGLTNTKEAFFLICNGISSSEQQLIVECHSQHHTVCLTSDLGMRIIGARNCPSTCVIIEAIMALEACAWVSGCLLLLKKASNSHLCLSTAAQSVRCSVRGMWTWYKITVNTVNEEDKETITSGQGQKKRNKRGNTVARWLLRCFARMLGGNGWSLGRRYNVLGGF